MRMNFTAQTSDAQTGGFSPMSVYLTIRPSRGAFGDFTYETDSHTLLQMLRQKTELRSTDLDRFRDNLRFSKTARLFSVEMSEKTLTELGYFVD